jgi:uncharacterized repeat protein (TIGR03803 family)
VNKSCLHFALLALVVIAPSCFSGAQTYSVLYAFGSASGGGIQPSGTLARDSAGNLYGVTQGGGRNAVGTIFKLDSSNTETILYNFNLPPDAMLPVYGVIRSSLGAIYGPAGGGRYGNGSGDGALFKLSASGKETVLHSFGSGSDGVIPSGGLVEDSKGNVYGVTIQGGSHGLGTIFRVTPAGKETILYNFTNAAGTPEGTPLIDQHGNLFGTTLEGGTNGFGAVFEFSASGKFRVIYSFCAQLHCADGSQPMTGVVQDSAGNLYGTTINGGSFGQGTAYKLTLRGTETVLHSFRLGGGDGYFPESALVPDGSGNFYGTTAVGGTTGVGTIFRVDSAGDETILHSFCAESNCADGGQPALGTLLRDEAGNLYGAAIGGSHQSGVVFKLTP